MKSLFTSLILVLITTLSYSQDKLYVEVEITGNRVNIRTEPNLTCEVIYQRNWGDTFLGYKYNDEWYELLDENNNIYYGYHKYIKETVSSNPLITTTSPSSSYSSSTITSNNNSTNPPIITPNYGKVDSGTLTEKKYPIAKSYPIGQTPKSTTITNNVPEIEEEPMVQEVMDIVEDIEIEEAVDEIVEADIDVYEEEIIDVPTTPAVKEISEEADIAFNKAAFPVKEIEKAVDVVKEVAEVAEVAEVGIRKIEETTIDVSEIEIEKEEIIETPITEMEEEVVLEEKTEAIPSDPQDIAFQNAQAQLEELTLHLQLEDNTKARAMAINIINNHVDHSTFTHLGSCVLVGEEAYNKYRATLNNDGSRIPEMRKLLNDVYDPLIINLIRLDIVDNWIQKEEYQYALDIMENIMTHNSESLTLPKHCENDPNRKATPQIELKNKYFLVYHLLDKKKKEDILNKLKSLTTAKNPVTQSIAKDIYEKLSGDFWEKN